MRRGVGLAALGIAAVLAACSVPPVTFTEGAEDCAAAGDEDGNGLADCEDPACASATVCREGCGNGRVEADEACDDGNLVTEACPYGERSCSVCDATCQPVDGAVSYCGDGVTDAGRETCDDGNATNGDGCDNNCGLSGGHTVPPNPALWLRFDDFPEDGVIDSTGGHTATCTSCPTMVPGRFNAAYQFGGTSRVDVAASPNLGPGSAFTVAAWVRIDTPPPGGSLSVIGCKQYAGSNCAYGLLMYSSGQPGFHSASGGTQVSTAPFALGTWHHMAMTWDGSTRVAYADGVMVATLPVPSMADEAGSALSIGARNYPASPVPFYGAVDDFLFYNRVLSAAELAQLATPMP